MRKLIGATVGTGIPPSASVDETSMTSRPSLPGFADLAIEVKVEARVQDFYRELDAEEIAHR
jgi:hypothetical protein